MFHQICNLSRFIGLANIRVISLHLVTSERENGYFGVNLGKLHPYQYIFDGKFEGSLKNCFSFHFFLQHFLPPSEFSSVLLSLLAGDGGFGLEAERTVSRL